MDLAHISSKNHANVFVQVATVHQVEVIRLSEDLVLRAGDIFNELRRIASSIDLSIDTENKQLDSFCQTICAGEFSD
jgi:hypothetical protein